MKMRFKILTGLLLIGLIGFRSPANGGILWADVGVNGLTCSMCSRSVEMSIRKLDFVDRVEMNLEHTEGRVYFKPSALINLDQVAKAVVNAGFSVRFLEIGFDFSKTRVEGDGTFEFQGQQYKWLDFPGSVDAVGQVELKLVDEHFLSKKEGAEWKKKLSISDAPDRKKVLHVVLAG
jgi:copper chaperone CopZ